MDVVESRRNAILGALRRRGGRITDERGRAARVLLEAMGEPFGAEALRKHLVTLESDGLIGRDVADRSCTAIYLIEQAKPAAKLNGRPRGERFQVYPPSSASRQWRAAWRDAADVRRFRRFRTEAEASAFLEQKKAELNDQP